jgi:hypothetical protein
VSILETKAPTILQLIQGLRGSLFVTFEEGTWAAWLYDLLKPHVSRLVVCQPRKNALLKEGSKSDRIDARKLAEPLRGNLLSPVYHGENGLRTLKEVARSYLVITKDLARVMSRIKALYRSWAIPCAGQQVYAVGPRSEWLSKITEDGVRLQAEHFYQHLDALQGLRRQVRRDVLVEAQKHSPTKLLRQISCHRSDSRGSVHRVAPNTASSAGIKRWDLLRPACKKTIFAFTRIPTIQTSEAGLSMRPRRSRLSVGMMRNIPTCH